MRHVVIFAALLVATPALIGQESAIKVQEFADHIQREIPKWAKVIKTAGVQVE